MLYTIYGSPDSSVGIAKSWIALGSIPGNETLFPSPHIQTSSGAYAGALCPVLNPQGCEANQKPPVSADVKNTGAIPPLPHTPLCQNELSTKAAAAS
jgi:hypothetical protein